MLVGLSIDRTGGSLRFAFGCRSYHLIKRREAALQLSIHVGHGLGHGFDGSAFRLDNGLVITMDDLMQQLAVRRGLRYGSRQISLQRHKKLPLPGHWTR